MKRLLAAVLAAASLQCAAAPFAVTLGSDRLVLDAVPGMTDALPLSSPRLQDMAESLTSASNRILLFALADADIRRFGVGEQLDLRRYMLMFTPQHLERERVTPEQFKALVADIEREVGKPTDPPDYAKFLDAQPEGQGAPIVVFRRSDERFSVLIGTRVPGTGGWWSKPKYILSTSTVVMVRNKALSLQVYTTYDGVPDLEWLRFTTDRWVDTLLKLNAR